jgi:hypothetical protein
MKTYFSKLKFRVINNIFHKEESGFSSKEQLNPRLTKRKILFCFYALIIPLPIIDSIRMSITYKSPTYLFHFIYLYYVCIQVVYQLTIKKLGLILENSNYGKD